MIWSLKMAKKPESVTVLGAGPTGLALGYVLSKEKVPVTFVEKTKKVGGHSASFTYEYNKQQYVLDYGPHKFYTQIDGIYDFYKSIMDAKNVLLVNKRNAIRIKGKDFDFPVKITQLATRLSPAVAAQIGAGVGMTLLRPPKKVETFEDHFVRGFGKYGYELLFRDYAKKVWGDPKTLSEELARKRVPVSSAFGLVKTMLKKPDKAVNADTFLYPKHGGYGALGTTMEKSIRSHGGIFLFDREPQKILWEKKDKPTVTKLMTSVGEQQTQEIPVDYLVSTIPINKLPALFDPLPPKEVLAAASALKFRSLRVFYLFFDKRPVMTDNWRFYPEERYIFNRVSETDSFSPTTVPQGKSVLMVEVTCGDNDAKAKMSDEEMFSRLVKDLIDAEVLKNAKEVKHYITRRASSVYPIYDLHFRKNLDLVLRYLAGFSNVITLGRPGLFNYNNADHCLDMGRKAAQWLLKDGTKHGWWNLLDYFDNYAIVD